MDNNDDKLAYELLKEVGQHARRWFIAFIIVLILWFATIGLFIWYATLPSEEMTIDQTADGGSQNITAGGNVYGGSPEDNVQTPSS